uniref:Uncharacterized protein n=1 Tax=Setaria viridis TaxID=4556 RepID=A0A4V6DC21_SETVI|nr:hypothetical protein SEVIR_4G292601v2 [Setaria viridis]
MLVMLIAVLQVMDLAVPLEKKILQVLPPFKIVSYSNFF